jgi:hypothetical protein
MYNNYYIYNGTYRNGEFAGERAVGRILARIDVGEKIGSGIGFKRRRIIRVGRRRFFESGVFNGNILIREIKEIFNDEVVGSSSVYIVCGGIVVGLWTEAGLEKLLSFHGLGGC